MKRDIAAAATPVQIRTYLPIGLVTVLGILITLVTFQRITELEDQEMQTTFLTAASDRILLIQREFDQAQATIEDIGTFFEGGQTITRRDFRRFIGPALKRYRGIVYLEWIPRVTDLGRSEFEEDARREFPRFRMTQSDESDSLQKSEWREVHFPILFVQPYASNKSRLGFDLASEPAFLSAFQAMDHSGEMGAMIHSPPGDDIAGVSIVTFLVPVYRDAAGTAEEVTDQIPEAHGQITRWNEENLLGFASGAFRIRDIVEDALINVSPGGINITVYSGNRADENELLYHHQSRLIPDRGTAGYPKGILRKTVTEPYIRSLRVADERWLVKCTAVPGAYDAHHWSSWIVLAGGLAFTVLLTIYLITLAGRAQAVRRLVSKRTLQLQDINIALNKEIAERKRAEADLQRLNETLEFRVSIRSAEAERRASDLEQFAYVASHDLKAPLRGISNLAAWLKEDLQGVLTDETREQIDLLQDRVVRMQLLVDGLLDYSRIGAVDGEKESVDTGKLLVETIDSLAPPEAFTIEMVTDMPTLQTDRMQLGQVFANLISNAIKHHGSPEGHVWISADAVGEFFRFSVADDGPGIAGAYHAKVFMMFQTLSLKDDTSNTGIGLALVKKIVNEHGGTVTLESKQEKGTVFRFTWPKNG